MTNTHGGRRLAALPLALLALLVARQSGTAQRVDVATELATTIGDGFTIASAGDLIAAYPSTARPIRATSR